MAGNDLLTFIYLLPYGKTMKKEILKNKMPKLLSIYISKKALNYLRKAEDDGDDNTRLRRTSMSAIWILRLMIRLRIPGFKENKC